MGSSKGVLATAHVNPVASRWRIALEDARVKHGLCLKGIGLEEAGKGAQSKDACVLQIFRQRSLLQEEWLCCSLPSRSTTLPTLLTWACAPQVVPRTKGPGVAATRRGAPEGCSSTASLSSDAGSLAPVRSSSSHLSIWSRLPVLKRCYSSFVRRCQKSGEPCHCPSEGDRTAAGPSWSLVCEDLKDAWAQAFMELSLALAGPESQQKSSEDVGREKRCIRSFTVPVPQLPKEASPPESTQSRLIELFYVVGMGVAHPQEEPEVQVLLREPLRRTAEGKQAAKMQEMLDHRVSSFCSGSQVPARVPFAFTILAAVLPRELGSEESTETAAEQPRPDPTDFLYCTAVCFDEATGRKAYCIVSRHPFINDFGDMLLALHDGTLTLDDLGVESSDDEQQLQSQAQGGAGAAAGQHEEADEHLRRAARRLSRAVPREQQKPRTHRSQTEPAVAREEACELDSDNRSDRWASLLNEEEASPNDKFCPARFTYPPKRRRSLGPWACEDARLRKAMVLQWAAGSLFQSFGQKAVLEIVTALLLEFRVIVVSESAKLGSEVVLGLSALLWPFSWQHLLLPICPAYLQEAIIDAPVPFICTLPEVTPQVASASRTTFTPRTALGSASARHSVVLCDASSGIVSIPPGTAHLLRPDQPHPHLACASEAADSAAIQSALIDLARATFEASSKVQAEFGTAAYMRQMEVHLCESKGIKESAFYEAFVNTETCLMFLALASKVEGEGMK